MYHSKNSLLGILFLALLIFPGRQLHAQTSGSQEETGTSSSTIVIVMDPLEGECTIPEFNDPNLEDFHYFWDVKENGRCPQEFSITRNWASSDANGNYILVKQTVYIKDTTPPYLTSILENLVFDCEPVQLPNPVFYDDCAGNDVEVFCFLPDLVETINPNNYEFPVGDTRLSFYAVDPCGNVSDVHTITVTVIPCDDGTIPVTPPAGDDPVTPPAGDDPVTPPTGDDPVTPPAGDDPVTPPAGDDPVTPPTGDDPVTPPAGDDPVTPPAGDDPVTPPAGDDPVTPPAGDDPVTPPAGDDPVTPPAGDDPITPPGEDDPVTPPAGGETQPQPEPWAYDGEYCSLTQGGWGNTGGRFCNDMRRPELIASLFAQNGELVIGSVANGRYFRIIDPYKVFNLLPGGGPSEVLKKAYSCQDPTAKVPGILASQTIALQLNLWLSPTLADLNLKQPTFYTSSSSGCGEGAYNEPLSAWKKYSIPQSVWNYLATDEGFNVGKLFALANEVLGGTNKPVPPIGDINNAVTIFNEAFVECKILQYAEPSSLEEETELQAVVTRVPMDVNFGPNPFKDAAKITLTPEADMHIRVEVYNMYGNHLKTIFEGMINTNETLNFSFIPDRKDNQNFYFIVIHTPYGNISNKMVQNK